MSTPVHPVATPLPSCVHDFVVRINQRQLVLVQDVRHLVGLLGHFADPAVGVRLAVVLLLQESLLQLLDGLGVSAAQRHQLALQLRDTTDLLLA